MCFENVPCMAFYIVKMSVWKGSQWDSFQTSALVQKSLHFKVSETLHACASSCLRMHALGLRRVFVAFYFPKKELFAHKKLYFPF